MERLTILWVLLLSEIYGVRCAANEGTTATVLNWADNITVTNYTEETVTISREHPGQVELCWQELPPSDTAPTCEHPPPDQTNHILRLDACHNHRFTMASPVGQVTSVEFSAARDGQGPGRPRGFKGLRYPGGVVLFEWVPPPPPGNYCIQHYLLRVVGGDIIADHIPSSSTSHEAHGLPVCGSVNVSLTAVNTAGRNSLPAHFKLQTQDGAPGAVRDLKVSRSWSHGLHLTWRRPERADCLREYAVCWRPTTQRNETCTTEKPSRKDLLWFKVIRLHHCTEYHLRVISVGAGKLQGISPTLTHSTGPDPVTNLKLDKLEEHQATVRWGAPACAKLYSVCWGAWSGRGNHFCLNTTTTFATITALRQGDNYTVIVAALGPKGGASDTRVITLQKPNPLEDLELLNDSPSSIAATWKFSELPGPVVDHVELCWTPLNGNSSEEGCVQLPPTVMTYTIHDLSSCNWYRVNVSTVHIDGAKSNPSSVELFTMDDGNTPAGRLEDFDSRVMEAGVFASWQLLEGCVSHVRVCWGPTNGTEQSCLTAPSHQLKVALSELRPCTNYSVTGTALAPNGTELDIQTTYRLSGAGRPRNVSAELVAPGTVQITWLPPPPGEDCVLMYMLDGEVLPANATEYTVTGVSPCQYKMHGMEVISAEDTQPHLIPIYYASGLSAPGAVRDLNALVIRSHSIHVGWKPPNEKPECLKKYSVCWREANTTTDQCDSTMYTIYPRYTILGLKPCTEYTISVAAVGGNATSNSTTFRKFTGPVAVEDVEAQQLDSQTVSLKWLRERCASLYSVCWGAWDGAGSHSCINVSDSKAKVFGLQNLHSGSNYTVILTAISRAGSISDSTILILQNSCPVSNLTVTDKTREVASVSWDLAPDCRQRVNHFEVCWERMDYDLRDCTHAGADASSFHLQQLRPCRWYNITVTAVYVDGVASQATGTMQFTDVPATKDPSPLASLDARVRDHKDGIELNWELNDEMDSCSEYVTACWTSSRGPDKGWCKRQPSYESSLVIDDAKFCSTYVFNVFVETVDKRQSKELNASIVLGPGPPQNVMARSPAPSSLLVTWEPPLSGDDCVHYYTIVDTPWDSFGAENISANATEYLLTDLPPCSFTFRAILAVSEGGQPSPYKIVYAAAGVGAPGEIRNFSAISVQSHYVHLQWSTPAMYYSCLKKYLVCWGETSEANETCSVQRVVQYPRHSISALKSCTLYYMNVSSQGEEIRGNSSQLQVTTGPDPVTNLKLDKLEEHQATVRWGAPACAKLYLVCWGAWSGRGSHFCLNTTTTFATITALRQGDNYTVIVAALGPKGGASDTRVITLQKPNPLEDLELLNDSPSSIAATWKFSELPGPVVDHVELCWTPLNGNSSEEGCVQLPPTVMTYTIRDLSSCNWYRVNVSTVHIDGAKSNPSSVDLFTMDDGNTPAGRLEDFDSRVMEAGVFASWQLLEGCVSHVRVCWGPTNGTEQSCLTAPSHQLKVALSELRPCTNYSVTGTALAPNGTELDIQTTYRLSGAGRPRNVSVELVAPGTVQITWLPPPPGEDCVLMYMLDGEELSANATEYTVTEVTPCQYKIHVMQVISAEDTQPHVIPIYYASGLSAPGAVRDLNALVIRSHSIHVGWKPPNEKPECLKKYSVCWREANTTAKQCDSTTYTIYPRYTILGLKPCTEYIISVAAVGGNATSNSTTFRKFTGPVAVEDMEAQQVDSQTVSLKWLRERCASLYSVCWGAWDGAGSHSCINVSDSKAKVFGLQNLHSGSNYTVILTAISRAGSISDSTILILQNSCPVSNLTVMDKTLEVASMSWDLAPDCRQRVNHFEVCWERMDYDLRDCTHAGADASSFHLQQLRPCRWYNITVTAVYVDGVASQATSILQFTGIPATKDPSPLASLDARVRHDKGGIELNWELNDEMDSCSEYVTACWTSSRDPDKGWCKRQPSYESSLVIDDAKFCSTYVFNVFVETVDKRQSKELNASIVLGPGPPQNVMARSPSPGTLLVTWEPPLSGDDCVHYYNILDGPWDFSGTENISANATEYLLTHLSPCSFTFHVILAVSEGGQPSPDKIVYAAAGVGAPGEIRNLSAISVQSHSVHLQWSTPAMYYSCLKKYLVCWGETFEANETCSMQRVLQYPRHSISALKSCTRYYLNVSSQGEEIRGNSSQLQVTTGPEPMEEVKMVATEGLVTFEWADVPCATSYSVCWGEWNGKGKHSCLTTSAPAAAIGNMAGLQPDGRYTIMVRAVGEDGGASSPYILYLVRPEPVEHLHVTSTSSGSISIAWAPSKSPAEEVHHLQLCSELLKTLYKNCSDLLPSLMSFTLSNMASCSWYNISITAFGHNNMRSPVAYVLQFSKGPETNGTAEVVELTTTSHGNSLSMSWKLSDSSCNAATRVCLTPAGKEDVNETCTDIPSYQTNMTIPDLEFCSEYSVSVTAGQESQPQTAVGSTAPKAVTELALAGQITSERELTVSWQPSACASMYQVCWDQWEWDDDAHHSCQNTSATNHTFSGLHWGTNYTVVVAALGIDGSSSDNPVIAVQLDADRSLDLKLQVVNPSNVTVAWNYSQGEGQPIHHLIFCLTLEASGLEKCKLVNTSDYEVMLAALQPCSGYHLRAKAVAADNEVQDAASLKFFTNQEGDQDSEVENKMEGFTVLNITSHTLTFKWDGLVPKRCIQNYELMATAVTFGKVFEIVLPNDTYSYTPEFVPPCQLMQVLIVAVLPDGSYGGNAMIKTDTGLQAPGEVEDIEAFYTSSSSIHIMWKPPSYKTECLVRYRVCWQLEESPSEAGNCYELTQTEFNAYSIKDLKPCTNYSISVAGVGGEKVIGNATYITLSTGPEPVHGLTAVRREPGEVTLGWDASACARAYSVCWGAWTGRGMHDCGNTTLTSYNITGLKSTTAYSFIVEAVKEDGQLSDKAVITWNETGTNDLGIRNFEITKVTATSVHLKWDSSPSIPVEYYTLEVSSSFGELVNLYNISSDVTTFVVDNLEPCSQLVFSLLAVSVLDTLASKLKTDTGTEVPGEVQDMKIFHTSSTSIHLQWGPPQEKTNCLLRYRVCWKECFVKMEKCSEVAHNPYNAFSINGLRPCTNYSISVAAMGSDKDVGNATVIEWSTGPEPVQGLTAVRRELGEVTLGWDAPKCARTYSICWGAWTGRGAHSCGNTSRTSYNITGLESATAYSFIVEAELAKNQFSANSVITWNGTAVPTSILGQVVGAVNKTVERTIGVASSVLGSLGL